MRTTSFKSLLTVLVLSGCSPGGRDDGEAPDAAIDPAIDATEAPEPEVDALPADAEPTETSVVVVATTPADGASLVSVLSTLTIELSGPVDPASVTPGTIRLYVGESQLDVLVRVTYAAGDTTVGVRPAIPLHHATSYRVEIAGLTADGVEVPAATARFRTFANPWTTQVSQNAAGQTIGWRDATHDEDGRIVDVATRSPGGDGSYGSADDGISMLITFGPVVDGQRRWAIYDGPGDDAAWRTPDDAVSNYRNEQMAPAGIARSEMFTAPGADGLWFTADDLGAGYGVFSYDESDRRWRSTHGSAGPDGVFATADDTVTFAVDRAYAGRWDLTARALTGPGADQVWFTPDDLVSSYTSYELDDRGAAVSDTLYGLGADGLAGTGDDEIDGVTTYDLNGNDLVSRVVVRAGAGVDGVWGSADDLCTSYQEHAYDGDGNRTTLIAWSPGADGLVGTQDDYVTSTQTFDPSL